MKDIDWIIKEQAALLLRKEYNEAKLNNPDAEGSYKSLLKDAIQHVLDLEAVYPFNQPVSIKLFGYFGQDKVCFTFSYDFDVVDRYLQLIEVKATLNNVEVPVAVENGRDLWKSGELYQRVKQLELTIEPHIVQRYVQRQQIALDEVFHSHAALLASKGYANVGFWTGKFNDKLGGISESSKTISYRQIIRSKTVPPLETRFHFDFEPSGPLLTLSSIFFKQESVSRLILHPSPNQIPIPKVISGWLKTDKAIADAQSITAANQNSKSSKIKR